jgi:hypothetical protein
MINPISTSGINPVQLLNAVNAFKADTINRAEENIMPETSAGLNINNSEEIFKGQNLDEIRNIAKIAGEENLSNDDIQYGLTYGRSVIADFVI